MRCAYLTLEAPREGQASYAHVHEIIAGLRAAGWTVALYQPGYSGRWERPPAWRRLLEHMLVQLRLLAVLPRTDVLYVRGHFMAAPAALAARALGLTVVHEVNGPLDDVYITWPWLGRLRRVVDGLQRLQYRRAAGLIAVTPQLAQWLQAEAPATGIAVVPNGANTRLFSPQARTARTLPARYVAFAGGLSAWHGVEVLARAADQPEWPAGVHLVVIGDGPGSGMIAAAASRNPLVVALGRLPYAEVPGVMAGALAGLITISDPAGRSRTGLAPIKLYETLACGVPVVATDLPGLGAFVREHGVGEVVPPDDPAALAAAVARLAADPAGSAATGARAAALIRDGHSWTARAEATAAFIQALRTGRRRP